MTEPGNLREAGESVKPEWGHRWEGSLHPPGDAGQGLELNSSRPTPSAYWNEDTRMCWLYLANIRTAILDGRLTTVLVDSGAHMNCIMPDFMKARGLVAGSIQDLNNHSGHIPINGAGGEAYRAPGVHDDSSADTTSPKL